MYRISNISRTVDRPAGSYKIDTFDVFTKDHYTSRKILKCLEYKPPQSPFLKNMNYCFLRSEEVPFGFVTARLTVQNIDIKLETNVFHDLEPSNLPPSIFGPRDALSESRLIAKDPRQTSPNWRVWTWSRADKTYKAWAEFGGTIESSTGVDVLLTDDQSESGIRVPTNLLSDADRASLLKGRLWGKKAFGDTFSLWRTLVKDDGESLSFLIPENGQRAGTQFGYCNSNDKRWIEKLRAATKQNSDSIKQPDAWQAFAGYVR